MNTQVPLTIHQAINGQYRPERLFKEESDARLRRAPRSSISTSSEKMQSVLVALHRSVAEYLAKYADFHKEVLERVASVQSGPVNGPMGSVQEIWNRLNVERVLFTDSTAWVLSEHDVVRESAKHLLHPVHQMLSLVAALKNAVLPAPGVPFQVRTLGESAVSGGTPQLISTSRGVPFVLDGRPDMMLVRCTPEQRPVKPTGDGPAEEFNCRSFCAFEEKNADVLDVKSWRAAIKSVHGFDSLEDAVDHWVREALMSKKRSFLDGSTLFWVLLKFSAMVVGSTSTIRDLERQGVGKWCQATLVPFDEEFDVDSGTKTGGGLAMQALLGFYIEAMENTPRVRMQDGTFGV
ncbi:hypothetical protein ACHAQH_008894 [Verticillium albo-atrum]